MAEICSSKTKGCWGWGASLLVISMALGMGAGAAQAQDAQASAASGSASDTDTIVVTGFRGSLAQSLDVKRRANNFVDAITAEDIGNFPDLNLAESLQRIPGVSIDREAGEGRTITVRGLSGAFTRVRVNGMEALTTTGGTDASGGNNRGRSFDFNVFASDLFSQVKVEKSQSAELEEGSLGATVDLTTGRPFDYSGFKLAFGGQAGYNDLSKEFTQRATFLVSDRWHTGLGDIGALFSAAYTHRLAYTEGAYTVRWEDPSIGNAAIGTPASLAFPCTGAAYNPSSGPALTCAEIGTVTYSGSTPTTPAAAGTVNAAYHPRIPRYGRLAYDQDRVGMTGAIQWQPSDHTLITLDGLYAKFSGTREESFIEALSFSRSGQGVPQMDVVDYGLSQDQQVLLSGTFDDTDVRSEDRIDYLSTIFDQTSLNIDQDFGDRVHVHAMYGSALSRFNNPQQTTTSIERYNVDGYSYDYSQNNRLPAFNYNFDVTNPANWTFSTSSALGDASLIRIRPQTTTNSYDVGLIDISFDVTDSLSLRAGYEDKEYSFATTERRRTGNTEVPPPLSAGDCNGDGVRGDCTIADITKLFTGFGSGMNVPAGTPTTWLMPDLNAIANAFHIYCNCIDEGPNGAYDSAAGPDGILHTSDDVLGGDDVDYRTSVGTGGGVNALNRNVDETDRGGYVQANFDTQLAGMRVRGDIGVRYVKTEIDASSNLGGTLVSVPNSYSDTLPSFNLVVEPTDNIQLRFAASKAMSRPDLPSLSPGGSVAVSGNVASISIGNPLLAPIRSKNYDIGFEWYFAPEAALTASYFYKDIDTFQQLFRNDGVPLSETGLPVAALTNAGVTGATDSTPVTIVQFVNTPGGSGNDVRGKASTTNVDAQAEFNLNDHLSFTFEGLNLTDQFNDQWINSTLDLSEVYEHTGRQYFFGFRYKY